MLPHLDTVATVRSTEHELALRQVGQRPRLVAPRAAVLPLACLLTLATGVALLVLAWTMTPPDVPPVAAAAVPSADGVNTVRAFYAAANDALRTGYPASLERLLAPDFVEHADRPGLPPGHDGLLPYLARLRAAHPTLRFTVEEVLANGDLVTVRVTTGSDPGRLGLGDLAADLQGWTGVDVFRVVAGQVAERWSGSDAPSLVQPLARVPLERWPPGMSLTAAARLTMPPGAEVSGMALPGPSLLVIEAGALAVRGSGEAQVFQGSGLPVVPRVLVPAGAEPVLGPGDVVAFPAGTEALSLRSEGTEPVVAVAVAWFPLTAIQDARGAGPGQQEAARLPAGDPTSEGALAAAMLPVVDSGRALNYSGITVVPLGRPGSLGAAQVPSGPVVVRLERMMLAPGTSLPPRAATGPTLMTVETGLVGLVPVRETARLRSGSGRDTLASAGSETTLTTGDSASWDAGAVALLRGGHGTAGSALLLTIGPNTPDHRSPP